MVGCLQRLIVRNYNASYKIQIIRFAIQLIFLVLLREAVHIATTGRPGPVVIDLPRRLVAKEIAFINDPGNASSYQPETLRPNEIKSRNLETVGCKASWLEVRSLILNLLGS